MNIRSEKLQHVWSRLAKTLCYGDEITIILCILETKRVFPDQKSDIFVFFLNKEINTKPEYTRTNIPTRRRDEKNCIITK